ncbi:MAG: MDR family MFS transporter [Alphaproteobacteria bacterium]|jgi:DHA2 family multidrug resistance protein|nr:MDR family MFS transporter [Alphaproteobacteria bacterium]
MTFRQFLILATVQLVTLLFGMTITIANVVLPQIKGSLSATQDQIAWVITFNLLATAVVTPMTGWLAERFGWRRLMLGAVIGFTISSALCGLADGLLALVLYRIGQGLFGAPLMPLGQAILLASFPKRQHALVIMLWGIGAVVGPVIGPVLGGEVAEALNWRWAFFIIVPFGLLALMGAHVALVKQDRAAETRLDWTGFLALAIAIGAAQLMLDRGQRQDWFESTEIVIEAAVAVVAFYLFVVHSLSHARPFLDPRLLLDRNFALGLVFVFVMGMLSFIPLVLFPPLLQELRSYPDSLVGTLLAARGIGNWVSFLVVVQLTRYNAKLALGSGLFLQAVAGWAMAQLDINLTSFDVFWTNLLQGIGFGLAYTPMTVLAFATLAPDRVTQGTAIFHMLRNFGSSLFISVTIVVWAQSRAMSYANLREHASPINEALGYAEIAGAWSIGTTSGLTTLSNEILRQASMIGYINAFYLFAIVAGIAAPFVLLLRNPE